MLIWRVGGEVQQQEVPDLTGLTRYMAEAILKSGGWRFTTQPAVAEEEAGASIGRVLSQTPAAGTKVSREITIVNLVMPLYSFDVEAIEGIGEKYGGRFRALETPITTLQELALLKKTDIKVPGVSEKRLGVWIDMANLMTTIKGLDGNAAEILVRGAEINTPDELAKKGTPEEFEPFYQKCLSAAESIGLPKDYLATYFTRENLKAWIKSAQELAEA